MCGNELPARTRAVWDDDAKVATCAGCDAEVSESEVETTQDVGLTDLRTGVAGASARREYERRHEAREDRIKQRFGFMAPVIRVIAPEPSSTTAWSKGAVGEGRLGAALSKRLGAEAVLLADCSVPRSPKNIDFIAIARTGVWVIDAKRYAGAVKIRDVGGWRNIDNRLYVAGRDRTSHVDGLGWQVDVVRDALGEESPPVTPVFCMVDAEFGLFAKPVQLHGVWVTWGKKLAEMIVSGSECMNDARVKDVARRLIEVLPPRV